MPESIQHKLDRVRPPRVQITYDVEIGDAIESKELPLVVGVLADLSGNTEKPADWPKLRDRRFVDIDRDSFREIFATIGPKLDMTVKDMRLADKTDSEKLPTFTINADRPARIAQPTPLDALIGNLVSDDPLYMFHPLWIIKNSPELKALYEARGMLSDLMAKLDGNPDFARALKEALADRSNLEPFGLEAGVYPSNRELPKPSDGNGAKAESQPIEETPPVLEAKEAETAAPAMEAAATDTAKGTQAKPK